MPEITVELVAILAYTAFALFLSLYFVPFKVVPKAWAKAVSTAGHPAQVALDKVLEAAAPKVAAAVVLPTMPTIDAAALAAVPKLVEGFNAIVPLVNNLTAENLEAMMKKAYSDMRKAEVARGDLPPGELTPAQQAELEGLRRDPDGKVQLVSAENAIDAAVNMKLLKDGTGKALKKQLNAAFASGQPIEAVLEPYKALLDRFLGGGTPSVNLVGGGSRTYTGKGPSPL